jgi:hypothetical protein
VTNACKPYNIPAPTRRSIEKEERGGEDIPQSQRFGSCVVVMSHTREEVKKKKDHH